MRPRTHIWAERNMDHQRPHGLQEATRQRAGRERHEVLHTIYFCFHLLPFTLAWSRWESVSMTQQVTSCTYPREM